MTGERTFKIDDTIIVVHPPEIDLLGMDDGPPWLHWQFTIKWTATRLDFYPRIPRIAELAIGRCVAQDLTLHAPEALTTRILHKISGKYVFQTLPNNATF